MKLRVFLKVAKGKNGHVSTKASLKADNVPLFTGSYNKKYLPTVLMGIDLDIPDSEFEATRILLKQKIESLIPAIEIKEVNINKEIVEEKESR